VAKVPPKKLKKFLERKDPAKTLAPFSVVCDSAFGEVFRIPADEFFQRVFKD
jgi:hypothetical protein